MSIPGFNLKEIGEPLSPIFTVRGCSATDLMASLMPLSIYGES